MPDPREVRSMFARISGRYDLLNHVLSMGIDRRWRRATVARAGAPGGAPGGEGGGDGKGLAEGVRGLTVVDVCCGTGDLAFAFADQGARVVGVDFTPEMLERTRPKSRRGRDRQTLFATGDALRLPIGDDVADVASVAFGVRNQADPVAGMKEMVRVVRPGGIVLVLEFSPPPKGLVGGVYRSYFTRVLPLVGGWISGDREAYSYLPRTVTAWPEPEQVAETLRAVGLEDCGWRSFSMGVACLHWGRVPRDLTGAAV